MAETIITITQPVTAELIEKKSRFIAQATPVDSEKQAQDFLTEIKNKHRGARHNVYAWVIGSNNEIMRSSDDGEPAGTGGKPVLETIKKSSLQNIALVVTRYFGGILLGAGGLTRAYAKAAQMALDNAQRTRKTSAHSYAITCDYSILKKTEQLLQMPGIEIRERVYGENIAIICAIADSAFPQISSRLADISNGTARIDDLGENIFINETLK